MIVTVGLSLMIGFHNIYSVLSWFGVLGFIAFTTYSVSCWFRMLGSGCFVFQVLGLWCLDSRCSVPGAWLACAWFRLTEYKVICYEKFVFNSLKRCYLWVFFLHFVFSLLFASFNFTQVAIYRSFISYVFWLSHCRSLFNDCHSRSLFNDWLSQHIFCIILVRGAWFYSFYNIFCIMLVPDAWFWVLCSRCLVSGAWFQVLGSGCFGCLCLVPIDRI